MSAKPRSLRRLLAWRLALAALVALVVVAGLGAVIRWRADRTAAAHQLDDARAYVTRRVVQLEHDWRIRAAAYRGGLESLRMVDAIDTPLAQARLTAMLASLGGEETFTHVVITDSQGRRLFDYASRSQDQLELPQGDAMLGWAWGPQDQTLYRSIRQPVQLGSQRGELWLYVPVDNAVLTSMAYPSTALQLRWHQKLPAHSATEADTQPPLAGRTAHTNLAWGGADEGPGLLITRRLSEPISLVEVQALVVGAGLATALLVWLVLGRWMSHHVDALAALQQAVHRFETKQRVEPDVVSRLAQAQRGGALETQALTEALRLMMQRVEQAQQALHDAKQNLEARVHERTRELETARDGALAASRAKEQFLASMSHELRTPLSGMLGGLDLLRDAPLPAQSRDFLEVARGAGSALLSIINQVLDYSKIEAGHLELASQGFCPFELTTEVAQLFRPSAETKGLVFRAELALCATTRVLGDPLRLRQVLMNLVGNAVKFTEHGTVVLRAQEIATPGKPRRLRFEVEDSGAGISAAAHERLFKPFVQGEAGAAHGGTGLGLAISHRLISAMGGRIAVDSEPGRGTCFQFSIDLPPAPDDCAAPGQPPDAAIRPLRPSRVLLVEDNPVNATVGAALLHACGVHEVLECDNGLAACELLEHTAVDLVLMDCQMPLMDGYAATARIRVHEAVHGRPHVPIIALTANVLDNDRRRCIEIGMDDFLPKPFSREQLRQLLAHWLGEPSDAQLAA